jgi:predicted nucleic acid-binding protein
MASFCLDTDVIVNILRGTQPLDSFLALVPFGVSTTMITLMELYYGAYKTGKEERIALVDSVDKSITVMDISEDDVKLAGKIMAGLEREGRKVDFRDVVIGAICINNELILITNNVKHFERMESYGLSISNSENISRL